MRLCLVAAVAVSAFGVAASGLAVAGSRATLTPVTQRVLSPPRCYHADDNRFHLEYELELTNGLPRAIKVATLHVRSGEGRVVETLSGTRLEAAMSLLATPFEPTAMLPPSSVGIVWLDLSFAQRHQIPRRIEHRLTVNVGSGLPVGPIVYTHWGQSERLLEASGRNRPAASRRTMGGGRRLSPALAPAGEWRLPQRPALRG